MAIVPSASLSAPEKSTGQRQMADNRSAGLSGNLAAASGTNHLSSARLRGLVASTGLGARWADGGRHVAGGGGVRGDAEGETLKNRVTTSQSAYFVEKVENLKVSISRQICADYKSLKHLSASNPETLQGE